MMQDNSNGTLQDRAFDIGVDTKQADVWNNLAWDAFHENPGQAQALAEKALKLSRDAGGSSWIYKKGVMESQRTLAHCKARQGYSDESLELAFNALMLADELGDTPRKCEILNIIAVNYKKLGDLSQSLENYLLMEQLAEKTGDKFTLGLATVGMGTVHTLLEDHDKARRYAERSLEIFQELGEKQWIAVSLTNLANALYRLGVRESLSDYYQRALILFHELGNERAEVFALCSLAEVYMAAGEMTLAMARLDQALTKTLNVKDPGQMAEILILTGKARLQIGQRQQAIDSFQQAADHAEAYKLWQHLYESHLLLSETYRALGDYQQALKHHERYHAVKETAFAEEKARQVQNLEALHHTREAQKEFAQLARMLIESERLATVDALTGIFNRRYFENIMTWEIARVRRYRHALSLIVFDVDDFPKIIEDYGHSMGDQTLKKIVETVGQYIRQVDVLARYDGEKFAILLPETDLEGARIVAERLQKQAKEIRLHTYKGDLSVTVSLGVVSLTEKDRDCETLTKRAADALHRAKEAGKNQIAT